MKYNNFKLPFNARQDYTESIRLRTKFDRQSEEFEITNTRGSVICPY
jgi:hypothetical protein